MTSRYWVPISASDCKHMPSDIHALLFALRMRRYEFLFYCVEGTHLGFLRRASASAPPAPQGRRTDNTRIAVSNLACHLLLKLECRTLPKLLYVCVCNRFPCRLASHGCCCTTATGSLEYAHQNAGPGQLQKTPAASCYLLRVVDSYHSHSHVEFACPSGYEESERNRARGTILAPLPPVQPYQTADRQKRHSDSCGERSWCPIRCCLHDGLLHTVGMERTAGPADHSRSRRPIIMRGTRRVGARVVASGGRTDGRTVSDNFLFLFFPFILLPPWINQRATPYSNPVSCS